MSSTSDKISPAKLKEGIENIRDEASEKFSKVREQAMVYREGAHEFLDSVSDYIKENPQTASMIAGAVGMGIGMIFGMLIRPGRRD